LLVRTLKECGVLEFRASLLPLKMHSRSAWLRFLWLSVVVGRALERSDAPVLVKINTKLQILFFFGLLLHF
jgi:hypothetical protein